MQDFLRLRRLMIKRLCPCFSLVIRVGWILCVFERLDEGSWHRTPIVDTVRV